GASRVAQAVALETVSMQIAKMLGPLAAGVCLARLGPAASYLVMALVYTAGLLASRGLVGRLGGPGGGAPTSVVASLRTGLQAAWTSPTVRGVLLVTVAMNTLFFPYQHMLPVFARDVLAVGPTALGALVAADGCGALLGALMIASRGGQFAQRTLFAASVLVAPVLLVALSGSRSFLACVALLVVLGAAESGFAAMAGPPRLSAGSAVAAGRDVAAVDGLPEKGIRAVLPELRDGGDRHDHGVLELALSVALHFPEVDVLDRIAVRVEPDGPPRRVGDL